MISLLLAAQVIFTDHGSAGTPWYSDANWLKRRAIVIDEADIPDAAGTLSNFPLLISFVNDTVLDDAGNLQADGDDVLFTAGDGTTKLDHDLDSIDSGTGTVRAWVRIPSLSATADTTIYMYYKNSGATAQSNPSGTWTGHQIVLHLNDNQTGGSADNATGGTDATYNPNVSWSDQRATGKIGTGWDKQRGSGSCVTGGAACDDPNGGTATADCGGTSACSFGSASNGGASTDDKRQFLDLNYGGTVALGGASGADITFSFWVYLDGSAPIPASTKDMHLGFHSGYNIDNDATRVRLYQRAAAGSGGDDIAHRMDNNNAQTTTDNSFTNNAWHYITLVVDSDATTNAVTTYLDGTSKLTGTFTAFTPDDDYMFGDITSSEQRLETLNEGTAGVDGVMDELQIFLGVRSANYISAQYANQNSPGVGGFLDSITDEDKP